MGNFQEVAFEILHQNNKALLIERELVSFDLLPLISETMKKRYAFLLKNCLNFGLLSCFIGLSSLNSLAQNGPAIQWDKTFGGNDIDQPAIVKQTSDGGYIVGGFSFSGISGDKSQANFDPTQYYADYWVIKLDASGNKIWDKTFGGIGDDGLADLQQTSDGGYILVGNSNSNIGGSKSQASKGTYDYWIIKLDAAGNKLWDKTFGGSDHDLPSSIIQTADGGYMVAGSSHSGVSGDKTQANKAGNNASSDYWIVKLNAQGVKIWDKTFGGTNYDALRSIIQTSDGGYMLGGDSYSNVGGDKTTPNSGILNFWLLKLDANGNKLWDKTLGGNDKDWFCSLQQTSDGGYMLGGQSTSGVSGDKSQPCWGVYDYWVVKLDGSGIKTWDKTYGGSDADGSPSVRQTSDGGYILGGSSRSGISGDKTQVNKGSYDFWVIKINASGQKLWDKSIGGSNSQSLSSLQQTADGGYILAGVSISGISGDKTQPSRGDKDFWIVKLAPDVLGIKEPESNSNLSIFPNPNQGKFNLQLSNLTSAKTEVSISDILGRTILKQEFNTTNNQLSEEINLPKAKGIYLLQLKTGNQVITRKIVVE